MPKSAANRVIRGGSWNNNARNVRSACRNRNEPSNRNNNLGFRCARARARIGRSAPDQAYHHGVCLYGARQNYCVAGVLVGIADARAKARRRS